MNDTHDTVKSASTKKHCKTCNDTGFCQYDEHHSKICQDCCPHDKGWWETTEGFAGFKKGADNRVCIIGCGTYWRDLPADQRKKLDTPTVPMESVLKERPSENVHSFLISEEERQLMVLSLALCARLRPGFKPVCQQAAVALKGVKMFHKVFYFNSNVKPVDPTMPSKPEDDKAILIEMLDANICPDCENGGWDRPSQFMDGPHGGICTNIKCRSCGAKFNHARGVHAERI